MTRPQRSERTIFPRHVKNPLRPDQLAAAKEEERQRKDWDPSYVTAEEVRAMPQDVASRPENASRIRYSREHWPENQANATTALGPLPTGEGQTVEERSVHTADVFGGQRVADDPGSPEV